MLKAVKVAKVVAWLYVFQAATGFVIGLSLPWLKLYGVI